MIDSTRCTTASAELALLSVVYHYVLAQGPSPEAANNDAIRAGAPKYGFKSDPKVATLATKGVQ